MKKFFEKILTRIGKYTVQTRDVIDMGYIKSYKEMMIGDLVYVHSSGFKYAAVYLGQSTTPYGNFDNVCLFFSMRTGGMQYELTQNIGLSVNIYVLSVFKEDA